MNIAGIDYSTHAIDVVLISLDGGTPSWHRFDLGAHEYAFERTRTVGDVLPGRASAFWDNVLAVGIEEPAGRNTGYAFCVQGAILSQIPARMLVTKYMPSEWRKAVGMSGKASKADVRDWVWHDIGDATRRHIFFSNDWPDVLDRCDAYCIALATRQAIQTEAAA